MEEKPVSIVFSSSEISLPVKRGRVRIAVGARFCLRLATKNSLRVICVGAIECHWGTIKNVCCVPRCAAL